MRVLVAGDFSGSDFKKIGSIYESLVQKINELGHIAVFYKSEQKNGKRSGVEKVIDSFYPDYIHVATNGVLGNEVKKVCSKLKLDYTTACFSPDIIEKKKSFGFLGKHSKCFHTGAYKVLTATNKVSEFLKKSGIKTVKWTPGVDTQYFNHGSREIFARKKPILLYINQGEDESGIRSFLDLKNEGTKVIVGSGRIIDNYKDIYRDVFFAGAKKGRELVDIYSSSDVLVVPEKEMFFSSSVLESLSCGTPVATVSDNTASEILSCSAPGSVDDDLEKAVENALKMDRDHCREIAMNYSLEKSARSFMNSQTIADF